MPVIMRINFYQPFVVASLVSLLGTLGIGVTQAEVVLMGGNLRNGNFNNLSNAVIDPLNGGARFPAETTGNNAFSTDPSGVAVLLNPTSVSPSTRPEDATWLALRRNQLRSGDPFMGFDESTSTPLGNPTTGDVAFTFRNGDVSLIGPRFFSGAGSFSAGDRFSLSYQVATSQSDDVFSHDVRFQLGGFQFPEENIPISEFLYSGSQVEFDGDRGFSIQGLNSVAEITLHYHLTEDIASDEIFLAFDGSTSSTLGGSGGSNVAAIDNINLIYTAVGVPEPGAMIPMLAGIVGASFRRHRRAVHDKNRR